MKRINIYLFCALIIGVISCGKIDNYAEPDAAVSGKIINASTKELIPCQAPNGAKIRLYENKSKQAIDFWCKEDGSFNNDRVFSGNYKMIVEGPFLTKESDTVNLSIPFNKEVIFEVEPFLWIKASATRNNTSAIVKFTISKSLLWNQKLARYAVVYSNTHGVDINNYIKRTLVNTEALIENNFLDKELVIQIDDLQLNKPIFVRAAARTVGTSYYNYSPIIKL